jgi:hypothetical protein
MHADAVQPYYLHIDVGGCEPFVDMGASEIKFGVLVAVTVGLSLRTTVRSM